MVGYLGKEVGKRAADAVKGVAVVSPVGLIAQPPVAEEGAQGRQYEQRGPEEKSVKAFSGGPGGGWGMGGRSKRGCGNRGRGHEAPAEKVTGALYGIGNLALALSEKGQGG